MEYTEHVLFPTLRNHFLPGHCELELEVRKRGYYPRGGGEVVASVTHADGLPVVLNPIRLTERGEVVRIRGVAHSFGLPEVICDSMVDGALKTIKKEPSLRRCDIDIRKEFARSKGPKSGGPGSGIVLWLEYSGGGVLGASAVSRKGVDPRHVGIEAADELVAAVENGGCVDEWMQDQLIIFMALADGHSSVNCGAKDLTLHTRTAIWVAEQLTDAKFAVKKEGPNNIIECTGVAYNKS
jgi:RNA 3'-terminal phosphate cyclase (ATP)